MPTVTNLKNYIWVANNVLTTFPSEQKNYDLEYYSDTNNTLFDHMIFGTNSLSYFITTPMSMPTVYSSSSWMRDALKTARIAGGTDVENPELIALLEANGTLVPYMITLDLTTIGLGLGEYTIQMSASDDEVSGLKDSDLSAPLQYTQGYNIAVTATNCVSAPSNPRMINPDETATLYFTFDGTSHICPDTAPTVTGATVDAWQKVDDSHGTLVISTATGAVSVTVEGEHVPSGHTVTIGIDDYRFLSTSDTITVYDGQDTSGSVLTTMTKTDHSDKDVICNSGHLCLDSAGGKLLRSFLQDGGVAYVSGDGTHTLVYSVTASGSLMYQADM